MGAGAEMLMKHVFGQREAQAGSPIDALEVAGARMPKQRVAGTLNTDNVKSSAVVLRLLISAGWYFPVRNSGARA